MPKEDPKTKELHTLFRKRQEDQRKATTKRRRQGSSRPSPCHEILGTLFAKDVQALRRIEETKAVLAWPKYVGEVTSLHARAETLRGDTLVIRVADPLWMAELSLLKTSILKCYRKDFPRLNIRELFFTR